MYKIITFDMFSAVLDIEGTAAAHLRSILPEQTEEKALRFFRDWRKKQWDYVLMSASLEQEFISYEYMTEKALEWACRTHKIAQTPQRTEQFMNIWFCFDPWPEAKEVIEALQQKGYRVGMLSNGDTAMLRALAQHCGILFDEIFSAQTAQAFKPHAKIYSQVAKKLGLNPEEHLHVAGSMFDVMGAVSHGTPCCWSNRHGDRLLDEKYRPRYETDDLRGLLDLL